MSQLSAPVALSDAWESAMRLIARQPRQAGTLFPHQGSSSLKLERGRKVCMLKSLTTTFLKAQRSLLSPLQKWTSREGKGKEMGAWGESKGRGEGGRHWARTEQRRQTAPFLIFWTLLFYFSAREHVPVLCLRPAKAGNCCGISAPVALAWLFSRAALIWGGPSGPLNEWSGKQMSLVYQSLCCLLGGPMRWSLPNSSLNWKKSNGSWQNLCSMFSIKNQNSSYWGLCLLRSWLDWQSRRLDEQSELLLVDSALFSLQRAQEGAFS